MSQIRQKKWRKNKRAGLHMNFEAFFREDKAQSDQYWGTYWGFAPLKKSFEIERGHPKTLYT